MMNRTLTIAFWILSMLVSIPSIQAQESNWPRQLPLEDGVLTLYAPQVDEMVNDLIRFRSALAYRETPQSEPLFGVGWFESNVTVDAGQGKVRSSNLKVLETRFPAGNDELEEAISMALKRRSRALNLDLTLDELQESLRAAATEKQSLEQLNTAPPLVIYRDHPALLVTIDGDPILREIENTPYEAVINTPYPLIFDGRHYYLNTAREVWYRANSAVGPYRFDRSPPEAITAMVDDGEGDAVEQDFEETITAANAPEIVVSTEPAELIVTEGPAAFVPLVDDLLVLQNSDDNVFMHIRSQEYYIVLSGRWYRAESLDGPWTYHPADDLPTAFASIPPASDQGEARVYVAGTEEAVDAVRETQVPQTAAVERGQVDLDVAYDGTPDFEPVAGTDMVYARNTGSTVILSDGLYYLVEDGVWYVSTSPNGPWQVSVQRPAQVVSILPSSPVYNVRYVYIYDSTPEVVYVGYTPGYTGSYVYRNTVVYGSGWYYRPWVSPRYYYPRHSTWGFHVNYTPWSGWNFGLSWGWGPFSVSWYSGGYWHRHHRWHHRYYGYWGPGGYRPRPVPYRHHRYARKSPRPVPYQRHRNLYRDGAQRARVAHTRDARPAHASGRNRTPARVVNTAPVRRSDMRAKAGRRDAVAKGSERKRLSASKRQATVGNGRNSRVSGKPDRQSNGRLNRSDLVEKANRRDSASRSGNRGLLASSSRKTPASGPRKPDTTRSRRDNSFTVNRSELLAKAEARDSRARSNQHKRQSDTAKTKAQRSGKRTGAVGNNTRKSTAGKGSVSRIAPAKRGEPRATNRERQQTNSRSQARSTQRENTGRKVNSGRQAGGREQASAGRVRSAGVSTQKQTRTAEPRVAQRASSVAKAPAQQSRPRPAANKSRPSTRSGSAPAKSRKSARSRQSRKSR